MVREGVLESPKPGAIFGLHVGAFPVGLFITEKAAQWPAQTVLLLR